MRAQVKARQVASVAILAVAAFAVSVAARPQAAAHRSAGRPNPPATPNYPAPENLKVLPKELSGSEIHTIMERWSGELGVRCIACHVQDPVGLVAGSPASHQFADDSKPMKAVARLMYTMTEQINTGFIAKVEGSGMPVTCGTCHRGSVSPVPFAPAITHQSEPLLAPSVAATSTLSR